MIYQLSQRLPHLPRHFDSLLCQNVVTFAETPCRPSRPWACQLLAKEYATAADTGDHFPFPRTSNPSPWDIFHLEKDASQAEIKARCAFPRLPSYSEEQSLMHAHSSDFELVRLYHPDVCKSRGLDPSLAESRFQAVTTAYNALRSGLGGSSFPLSAGVVDGEAEEIRNRLATWRSREQSRGSLVWMRRQRALGAEADAGKWWKSDRMLVYSLASVVSDASQRERI